MVKRIKKDSFVKRMLKGIGYHVVGEVMSAFLVITMIVLTTTMDMAWIKIVAAVFTQTVVLGLFFNWAHNAAKADRDEVKFHGAVYDKLMPVKMAILGPAISYISIIALILSKCGAIADIFNVYLLVNMHTVPVVDAFTDGRTLEFLSVPGLLGLIALVLLQPLTIILTYILTYNDVDVITKVVYSSNKK